MAVNVINIKIKYMKRLVISTFFCLVALTAIAQTKAQRRIYLWDVTLSMKGFEGKTPDIYDDVVKFLEQDISNIKDESTEIFVLPFQEKILERWNVKADESGKAEIIRKIRTYSNNIPTNTDIVKPVKDVQASIIQPDKDNLLILLTDGMQSKGFGGKPALLEMIKGWGPYASINNAYCLYVMLTDEGRDNELEGEIGRGGSISAITGGVVLRPEKSVTYNYKDDKGKPVEIPIRCLDLQKQTIIELPPDLKIRVIAENNQYFAVDQEYTVRNNIITFDLTYKHSVDTLSEIIPEKTSIPLRLELVNQDDFQKSIGKIVTINPDDIILELINKPEKRLRIYYE